jgi:ABC-2 type transport system permease protein
MLLINEGRYLVRQPLFWLTWIILPLVAYLFAIGIGGLETLADKRLQALHMTLLMMSLPLLSGALAPLIFLRDQANDMAELILVTPQSPTRRLFVRWLSLFLVCAGQMLISFLIMWFILSQNYGFQGVLLGLTLWDFALMALPACAFFSALACCLAQGFASNVVLYVFFCTLWLAYLVLASMTGSPMLAGSSISNQWLFESMRMLDPFGNTALLAYYQNAEPKLYGDVIFYLNRLFYCLLAAGLFIISLKLKPSSACRVQPPNNRELVSQTANPYQPVNTAPKAGKQLLQLSYMSLTTLVKQRLSQFILFGWTLLMFNEVLSGINYAEPMSVLKPTSLDALNRISDDVLPLMGCFLVLFWSWQLCWRNRQAAMAELISAAPVRSGILMLSHVIALSVLILLLMLLTVFASLMAETLADSQIQLIPYITQLSMVALSLLLLGAIFTALHTMCRSPLVAVGWCIAVLVMKYTPLSGALGLTHTLWNIGASPLQPADAFWGLEQSISLYWPFMTFWMSVTVTLLWLAALWSHRTNSFINHRRWQLNLPAASLLLLTLAIGINLHNNISSERPLMSSDMREQWRADYEQQYASWAAVAQPAIKHIDAEVAIFPQKGEANFILTYTLENQSADAIDTLLIGHNLATPLDKLELSLPHTQHYDVRLGQYVVDLKTAIKPGEQLRLSTQFTFKQPRLWPAVMHQLIKPTFSYLRGIAMLPTVGFQPQYQLRNAQLRQEYDLAPLNLVKPSRLFAEPKPSQSTQINYDWVGIHSIISTNAEQVPLAQGELLKQWQKDGRNYAEYKTKGAIRNAPVWFSVPKHKSERQTTSTLLSVYSPEDSAATQVNLQAMQDTLNWMTTYIAPYRASRLSLIAMPNIGPTGYALPQMMMINYRVGFRAQPAPDAGFDQRYRRTVHETAHQWFGHDLGNGALEDSAFLVESLAKYVELVLIEQHDGKEAMQALVNYERQRYKVAIMHSTEQNQALVDGTENHDLYSRATLVFAILRDKLGDEVITASLRQLWQQHAYPQTPATAMDFVRALKGQVNEQHQALVDELLLGTDVEGLL